VSRHSKGKRRRAKTTAPQVPPRPPHAASAPSDERPQAPWHPFPLIELSVLIGIVCIVAGLIVGSPLVLALGFALGALGGLDTALREHFSGYRSHALVLAAFPAVASAVLLAFAKVPPAVVAPIAVAVFGVALIGLRRV